MWLKQLNSNERIAPFKKQYSCLDCSEKNKYFQSSKLDKFYLYHTSVCNFFSVRFFAGTFSNRRNQKISLFLSVNFSPKIRFLFRFFELVTPIQLFPKFQSLNLRKRNQTKMNSTSIANSSFELQFLYIKRIIGFLGVILNSLGILIMLNKTLIHPIYNFTWGRTFCNWCSPIHANRRKYTTCLATCYVRCCNGCNYRSNASSFLRT